MKRSIIILHNHFSCGSFIFLFFSFYIIEVIMNRKRKNSETENDLYYNKIIEKSSIDPYFRKLEYNKQIEIINKETEIYNYHSSLVPIRYKIIYSNLPMATKLFILNRLDSFDKMSDETSEYSKLSKWIQGLSLIPFDSYMTLQITLQDGNDKINQYLHNAYKTLNSTIYGQYNVKNKIIQILAQWITNPNAITQILALEGPAGVGKTSLVKDGVSKILDRPFSFYALGGANDVSVLEGHSYTYEGAMWGRILEMLMESKVMNPILFFDELDKISKTTKGNEMSGLLIHLTDTLQNNLFQDKYFSGIHIDLSKAMFIFSFNDIKKINPILKNRLTIVKFEKYDLNDKVIIVRDYVLPKIFKNIGFEEKEVIFNDNIIKYIITKYVEEEEGIRNSKICFETILMKINLFRLLKKNDTMMQNDIIKSMEFPVKITEEIVDALF